MSYTSQLVIHYGGSAWGRVHLRPKDPETSCFHCDRPIRRSNAFYRTRSWGAHHNEIADAHGKCLAGMLDPTIHDIGIGR